MRATTGSARQAPAKSNAKSGEPRKRGPYVSETMVERRRRVIEVTKAMIAERGADGFTIRELTERADVSVTVVYSTYVDKEGLIAAAIQDFYENLPIGRRPAPKTLTRLLDDIDEAAEVILANAAYSRSLVELYFSCTADPRVYAAIRAIAIATFLPWLENALSARATVPDLPLETMCQTLANDRWSVIFDWARGRVRDQQLAKTMKTSFLITACGLTIEPIRSRVDSALRKILRT